MCRSVGLPRGALGLLLGCGLRVWLMVDSTAKVHGPLPGLMVHRIHRSPFSLGSWFTRRNGASTLGAWTAWLAGGMATGRRSAAARQSSMALLGSS